MKRFSNIFDLSGKKALITGSQRGIGAAIAQGLAEFGAEVAVHGQKASESGDAVCNDIRAAGGKCEQFDGDLALEGAAAELVGEVNEAMGAIDILVINASAQINTPDGLSSIVGADFQTQVNVNIRSTLELLQATVPDMVDREWGRVVNVGSINQRTPKSIVAVYAATKAAQHNLITSFARDTARAGVLMNTLAPGLVATDRNSDRREADPIAWESYVDQLNWMGREGAVEEMVGATVFLSSQACSFMTGETLFATGGQ